MQRLMRSQKFAMKKLIEKKIVSIRSYMYSIGKVILLTLPDFILQKIDKFSKVQDHRLFHLNWICSELKCNIPKEYNFKFYWVSKINRLNSKQCKYKNLPKTSDESHRKIDAFQW